MALLGYIIQVMVNILKLHSSLHMKLIYQSGMIGFLQKVSRIWLLNCSRYCDTCLESYYFFQEMPSSEFIPFFFFNGSQNWVHLPIFSTPWVQLAESLSITVKSITDDGHGHWLTAMAIDWLPCPLTDDNGHWLTAMPMHWLTTINGHWLTTMPTDRRSWPLTDGHGHWLTAMLTDWRSWPLTDDNGHWLTVMGTDWRTWLLTDGHDHWLTVMATATNRGKLSLTGGDGHSLAAMATDWWLGRSLTNGHGHWLTATVNNWQRRSLYRDQL